MVKPAKRLAKTYGISEWTDFRCADAAIADGLDNAAMVWLNDYGWPAEMQHRMYRRLATSLLPGAVVVSMNQISNGGSLCWGCDSAESSTIPLVDSFLGRASWSDN